MNKTVLTTLTEARALIDSPEKWTRGAFARNSKGEKVEVYDPNATCFCVLGALIRCESESVDFLKTARPLRKAFIELGTPAADFEQTLPGFNDSIATTHEIVLTAFDKAIEIASAFPDDG